MRSRKINNSLRLPNFSPRALFDRFNIDVMATTEGALETLQAHREIANSSWNGRVITTYRPDILTDPDHPNFSRVYRGSVSLQFRPTHGRVI